MNELNFMIKTKALFKGCKIPLRDPDYISSSGSKYWYGENSKGKYVIRLSDHWSAIINNLSITNGKNISTCKWLLYTNYKKAFNLCGKTYFDKFSAIE